MRMTELSFSHFVERSSDDSTYFETCVRFIYLGSNIRKSGKIQSSQKAFSKFLIHDARSDARSMLHRRPRRMIFLICHGQCKSAQPTDARPARAVWPTHEVAARSSVRRKNSGWTYLEYYQSFSILKDHLNCK